VPDERVEEAVAGRLAAIVESSDDAIISKTLAGIITSWNQSAERLFGYTAAEAIGQHILLIIPDDRRAEEDEVLARLRRGERIDHFETIRRTKSGRLIEISLTVSPVRNGAGQVIGASKVARDISDRRRLERERQELLEREQAARAEAEILNRSKDQFLATLSHELRTPLNAIYGWSRMLDTGRLDAQTVARATQAILRNARAQVQLIEDLFDVSRAVTGNMRLDVRPMSVSAVLEAAVETVRPAAAAKRIQIELVRDPRTAPIMGDPDRLQQVVWNLLINAVKFTPIAGRVELRVQSADSRVEIVVADTGEGIAPENITHLFERFHQVDATSTRRHGGLGIGLALVRHIVELHGGRVGVTSEGLGHGTTFTVTLPVAAPRETELSSSPPPVTVETSVPAPRDLNPVSLRDVRVLVVDDDIESRELAGLVLTNGGGEVRTAASAAAAMAILESWIPDVLVADLEMPEEDGFSFLPRARRALAAQGRRLPALALTAYGQAADRVRALAVGYNLHLTKPADPGELTLAVASLAGRTG